MVCVLANHVGAYGALEVVGGTYANPEVVDGRLGIDAVFLRNDGQHVTIMEAAGFSGDELVLEYTRKSSPGRLLVSAADLVAYAQINQDRLVLAVTLALQNFVDKWVAKGNRRLLGPDGAAYVSIPTEVLLREPMPIAILPVVGLSDHVKQALRSQPGDLGQRLRR